MGATFCTILVSRGTFQEYPEEHRGTSPGKVVGGPFLYYFSKQRDLSGGTPRNLEEPPRETSLPGKFPRGFPAGFLEGSSRVPRGTSRRYSLEAAKGTPKGTPASRWSIIWEKWPKDASYKVLKALLPMFSRGQVPII